MNLEPIDTSTTAGKAEVMRLAAEGRTVVCRGYGLDWRVTYQPEWDWPRWNYAIICADLNGEAK